MTRAAAIASAVMVFAAAPAQTQVALEITPLGGGTVFLADLPGAFALDRTAGSPLIVEGGSLDPAWTLGMNAGITLSGRWALEGMFAWTSTDINATGATFGKEAVKAYVYGLTALYYVAPRDLVSPFFGVGVGGATLNYGTADFASDTALMGSLVAGLHFAFTDVVGLRFEARDWFARFDGAVAPEPDKWTNGLMMSVGLSFRTGGGG